VVVINERFGSSGSTCVVNSGESPGCDVDERRVSRGGLTSATYCSKWCDLLERRKIAE
jgi:hypothetical protein